MKSLKPEILEASKYWLKHVFFPLAEKGSVRTPCTIYYKDGTTAYDTSEVSIACKELFAEATDRAWKDLDATLMTLSNYSFNCPKLVGVVKNTFINMSASFVSEAIAWMCRVNDIAWDDLSHSKYELDYFKKTELGKALWGFECFASQYIKASASGTTNKPRQNTTTNGQTANATSKSSGSNSWKARGPLSSQVRDLVSQPGVKEFVSTGVVYTIDDTSKAGKKFRVFIRPLKPAGAINGTNKVFIGNSNNYEDCTCIFDNREKAREFLDKIEASGAYQGTLSIERNKVDANGYFEVGTELGKCLIRAFNLNEAVEDILEESLEFSPEEKFASAYDKFCSYLD